MPVMRMCIEPGCGALTTGTRCATHEKAKQAAKWAKQRAVRQDRYGYQWRQARAAAVAAWVGVHGWQCPGLTYGDVGRPGDPQQVDTPAHPSTDLTGDHRADGTIGVLCRGCNSSRGARNPVFKRGGNQ